MHSLSELKEAFGCARKSSRKVVTQYAYAPCKKNVPMRRFLRGESPFLCPIPRIS